MATLCSVTCGAANSLITAYDDECTPEYRPYGAEYFGLVRCDVVVDLTVEADVIDAVDPSGSFGEAVIAISPRGKLIEGDEDAALIEGAYGCGEDIPGIATTPITFTTPNTTGCESTLDYDYFSDLIDTYQSKRFFWVDCCGIIHYDKESNDAGLNPGFKFGFNQRPKFVEYEGGYGQWSMIFAIQHNKSIKVFRDLAIVSALGISI